MISSSVPDAGLQIVGLGMATLDVLIRLDTMPTWEHGSRVQDFGFDGGGPVGTAMVAAAKLGARVGFIGTAGNDIAADLKLRSIREAGVDLSHLVIRDAPEDQIIIVYVHAETGERIFSGVHRGVRALLRPEELDRDYITSAEYLHLEGFHREAAVQAAQWMQAAGKTVVLDGSKTKGPIDPSMRDLISHVDVLISGDGFVEALTGIEEVAAACKAALESGPRIVVQTVGAAGSYTATSDEHFHTPAFSCDVVDTTGAGDVFHGAYIVGLLQGWNVREIARFSTAVSAIKCSKLGGRSGIPTFDEVMAYLEARDLTPSLPEG
jgi:sugar/nucleoside kinase (ribokinase family)